MKNLTIALFAVSALYAQNPYGRITGRVTDSAAALVPGATVRAVQSGTNVVANTVSNAEGIYEFPALIPGGYTLIVEHSGFKRYERGPIELRLNDVLSVEIQLEVGLLTESVTIRDEAPMLESANASVGQLIDNRRLADLPLAGGSLTYTMQLAPSVISNNAPTHGWLPQARDSQSSIAVAGTRQRNSEFTLDGIPNMTQNGLISFAPPVEVVQEMRVQTAPFDASVGHFTGAYVNMVLKSGTNELHGNLLFAHTSRPLMSVPFFINRSIHDLSTGPPTQDKINSLWPFTRTNRYRGGVTGPVWIPKLYNGTNRTFWMYGFENMLRLVPYQGFFTVPTARERTGDFSELLALPGQYQIYDPATITPAPNGRTSRLPFAGNIIPQGRISPIAAQLMKYYPSPNASGTSDGRNNYTGAPPNRIPYWSHLVRIDHNISPSHRIYGSLSQSFYSQVSWKTFNNEAAGSDTRTRYKGFAFDDVLTLRPDLVLNFRYGLTRLSAWAMPNSLGTDLGALGFASSLVNRLDRELTTIPAITIDQYTAIGDASGSRSATNYHTISGSVSHIRGQHTLRMGGEHRAIQENSYNYGNISPQFTFGTLWTRGPLDSAGPAPIGQGLAAFLLGLPESGYIDRNASYAQQSRYTALYLQDDWKISRRVTVNLGLRYELEGPTTERFDRANRGFDLVTANPIQDAARAAYARSPIAEISPSAFTTTGGLLFANTGGQPRGLWNSDRNNFSPRIGIAWQVQPTMVVRTGYGIFYETLGAEWNDILQQGFSQRSEMTPSFDNGLTFRATLANPYPEGIQEPAGASAGLRTFLGRDAGFFDSNRKPGYMQRWNLDIQKELPHRLLFEIGYTGNRGTGLAVARDINAVPLQYLSRSATRDQTTINHLTQNVTNPFAAIPEFAGSALRGQTVQRLQLLRPYPHFTNLNTAHSRGFSWYHALHLRGEKRMSQGFTVQVSYTWSKFMEAVDLLNAADLATHHVVSQFDRPHHVAGSFVWELPFGRGKAILPSARNVVQQLVGGWSVQGMLTLQSGPPLGFANVIFNGDIRSIALKGDERQLYRWFNTGAGFETRANQQLLQNVRTFPMRLTGARADGFNSWDLSAFKGFKIKERLTFQLRVEAQDALNNAMFAAPNTVPQNSLFGQVTTTIWSEQRRVTVGGRLTW